LKSTRKWAINGFYELWELETNQQMILKRQLVVYFQLLLLFIDLNVSFSQRDHLRQNAGDVKILHFVPLIGGFVENVSAISSFSWLAVMHNVGHQVVASLLVLVLVFGCQDVTKVNVSVGAKEKLAMQVTCRNKDRLT